ncbi:hypothetical protein SLA2020_449420 [Shorea laevis]
MEAMVAFRQLSESFPVQNLVETHHTIYDVGLVGGIVVEGEHTEVIFVKEILCAEMDCEEDDCDDNGVPAITCYFDHQLQ